MSPAVVLAAARSRHHGRATEALAAQLSAPLQPGARVLINGVALGTVVALAGNNFREVRPDRGRSSELNRATLFLPIHQLTERN